MTDALERIAKVEIPAISPILGSDKIWEYRNKMEYTFSAKKWRTWEEIRANAEFQDSSNALGFHIPGAFDKVLHISRCHLQDSVGDAIRNHVFDYAEANGLSFYDIKQRQGLLRTMMIRIASTGEIMVCMVFGEDDKSVIEPLMNNLAEAFPQITSLLYVVNLKLNDTIFDQDIITFKGRDYIVESMEGLQFRVNAKSFYQTNSLQAYELYKVTRRLAGLEEQRPENERPLVYDLYTGTGTIANFVARNCRQVVGIEYVPEAIDDARLNSQVNGLDNTLFYAGDMKDILTDEFVARHGRPDVMIIDPPRAGMHEDVVNVILNAEPDVLVYVSCNPPTQARDILGGGPIIGVTVNSADQIGQIRYFDIDYIAFGPYNADNAVSLEDYSKAMQYIHENHIEIPVVAIGNITPSDAKPLMQAGVNGLAVSEAIADSDNLATTTAQFITLLDTPNRIG